MSDPTKSRILAKLRALGLRILQLPVALLAAATEPVLTSRGLGVAFLLLSAFLVKLGWLRPPIGPDLRSYHIPLGVWPSAAPSPEELMHERHRFVLASAGTLMLAVIVVGLVLVLWRPRYRAAVIGLVLCVSLAANAVAAFNQPVLVELMDREYEQRQQLASLNTPLMENILITFGNGRIGGQALLNGDEQRGDLSRGPIYLLYGTWLVLWALGGTLLAASGSLGRRLRVAGCWTLAGVLLSCLLCLPRLAAEYYWVRARYYEAEGDCAAARAAVQRAVAIRSDFQRLERTWIFLGKLDFREHLASPQARYFQAYQLARNKGLPRAISSLQDVPWMILGAPDYRQGLAAAPVGPFTLYQPSSVGTPDFLEVIPAPQGILGTMATALAPMDQRRGIERMRDLKPELDKSQPALAHQEARLRNEVLVAPLQIAPPFINYGWDYFAQKQQLTYVEAAARKANALAPDRQDSIFYLASAEAMTDRHRPTEIDARLDPLTGRCADSMLHADILSILGDSYFESGLMNEARGRYARAYDLFSLPKNVNYRAQRGLGGDL